MFKTTKKDLVFFDLLSSMMEDTCVAADLLLDLLTNYNDVDNKIKEIEKYEHKCDKTVHELVNELNRSFITPIDREDIFDLTKAMDNITDNIEFAAQRLNLFAIQEIRPRAVETAKLISSCVKELKVVVDEMKQMRTSKLLRRRSSRSTSWRMKVIGFITASSMIFSRSRKTRLRSSNGKKLSKPWNPRWTRVRKSRI